jgi:hypothetical protein
VEKIQPLVAIVNKKDSIKLYGVIFPLVYKLLDEYMASRGNNITNEMKTNIENLVKAVYYEQGPAFIENAPSNKLSKIFEIVNKDKKQVI